jgi:hypothetical protein
MTVQKRNGEMVELLSADLQHRYEPQFAAGNIASMFQMLHELRGFWPFSSINESGAILDLSGQGRTLTNTNTGRSQDAAFVAAGSFNGASSRCDRADEAGLDVTGNLTIGAWMYPTSFGTNVQPISKDGAAGQFSYHIQRLAGNAYQFQVSSDGGGGGLKSIDSAGTYSSQGWHFVVGRFITSTEIAIYVNGVKTSSAVGVPASIFNSNSAFSIGSWPNGGAPQRFWPGYMSLAFVCAAGLKDALIQNLYQQSRAAFGV